eukprot:392143-Amphidinium_carterae.3
MSSLPVQEECLAWFMTPPAYMQDFLERSPRRSSQSRSRSGRVVLHDQDVGTDMAAPIIRRQ